MSERWGWYMEGSGSIGGVFDSRREAALDALCCHDGPDHRLRVGPMRSIDIGGLVDADSVRERARDVLFETVDPVPDVSLRAGAADALRAWLVTYLDVDSDRVCDGEEISDDEVEQWRELRGVSDES
jgi:hypothetical protein